MARTKLLERGWTRQPYLPLPIRIPHTRDRHRRLSRGLLPNTKLYRPRFPVLFSCNRLPSRMATAVRKTDD
jgi:hypothetical protein